MAKPFELGLVMAGAISGGAYTAGVVDFLIEALDAWEAAKADPSQAGTVPQHKLQIRVLSGASAGSMCSALAAIALHAETTPVHDTSRPPPPERNRLFHSWVKRVDITDMLKTDDVAEDGATVRSMLNSGELGKIAREGLRVTPRATPRPYVSGDLALYLTVANLRGVPYDFGLVGGRTGRGYGMLAHADHMRFLLGPGAQDNALYTGLDTNRLPDGPNWELFADSALASGAFPIGLQPRHLRRPASQYAERFDVPVGARFPAGFPDEYDFLCVDGGLMNNEPLELARRHLAGRDGHNPREGDEAHRAVVMIDPFPNRPAFAATYAPTDDVVSVLKAMFGALVDQARFKPEELALAERTDVFSRFAISPSLTAPGTGEQEEAAMIASILGGFGGFLAEDFRRHDFELGRRNCQRFLQRYFTLPANNEEVFEDMAPGVLDAWCVRHRSGEPVYHDTGETVRMMPLVPLVGDLGNAIDRPKRPDPNVVPLDYLQERIESRSRLIGERLIENHLGDMLGTLGEFGAQVAFRQMIASRIASKARDVLENELGKIGRLTSPPQVSPPRAARRDR